jgi:ubiquitin-protein ligase
MEFPDEYPQLPPKLAFVSKFWHPNVYSDGRVCISILHAPELDPMNPQEALAEKWRPIQSIGSVLISVMSMLADPNTQSAANVDANVEWMERRGEFVRKAASLSKRAFREIPSDVVGKIPHPEIDGPVSSSSNASTVDDWDICDLMEGDGGFGDGGFGSNNDDDEDGWSSDDAFDNDDGNNDDDGWSDDDDDDVQEESPAIDDEEKSCGSEKPMLDDSMGRMATPASAALAHSSDAPLAPAAKSTATMIVDGDQSSTSVNDKGVSRKKKVASSSSASSSSSSSSHKRRSKRTTRSKAST